MNSPLANTSSTAVATVCQIAGKLILAGMGVGTGLVIGLIVGIGTGIVEFSC
ncbi:hypothetical protein [Massilia sp. CF038]|uniref:hypothetical protein n=1 Tax=Massilia sp. CF038 TaxID=1881045 RepID=UPI00091CD19F|nr:hypothetical protein [Massilia sp. CF038]SHH55555.1 hypothetical protein SAMN05428948_4441 [Massilia sp. CF038]